MLEGAVDQAQFEARMQRVQNMVTLLQEALLANGAVESEDLVELDNIDVSSTAALNKGGATSSRQIDLGLSDEGSAPISPTGSVSLRASYAIAFQYANPLLNDPELPHLLKLAQSAYGAEAASQLIDLGENSHQYLKLQSLRKAHGDAEAVKLILAGKDSSSSHVTHKAQTASIASDAISNVFFIAKELIEHKSLISYIMPELSSAVTISTYEWIGLHFATTVTLAYFLPAALIAKAGFVVASTGIFALREIIRDDINTVSHDEPIYTVSDFAENC